MPCTDTADPELAAGTTPSLRRCLDPDLQATHGLYARAAAHRARQLQLVCAILGPGPESAAAAVGSKRHLCSPIFQHWLGNIAGKLVAFQDPGRCEREVRMLPNMLCTPGFDADIEWTLAGSGGWIATWDPHFALRTNAPYVKLQRTGNVWNFLLPGRSTPSLSMKMARGEALRGTVVSCDGGIEFRPGYACGRAGIVLRNDLPALRLSLHRFVFPARDLEVELDTRGVRGDLYRPFDVMGFRRALGTIEEAWPEQHRELTLLLNAIIPVAAPAGWSLNGYTISSLQGACWIGTQGHVNLVEHLVHECSHIKLRYVEESRPILDAEQTPRRFHVAWRDDPRPIVGIFEGVYVGIKSILMLARARTRRVMSAVDNQEAGRREQQLRHQVAEALPILASHARFAPGGSEFLDWAQSALR